MTSADESTEPDVLAGIIRRDLYVDHLRFITGELRDEDFHHLTRTWEDDDLGEVGGGATGGEEDADAGEGDEEGQEVEDEHAGEYEEEEG